MACQDKTASLILPLPPTSWLPCLLFGHRAIQRAPGQNGYCLHSGDRKPVTVRDSCRGRFLKDAIQPNLSRRLSTHCSCSLRTCRALLIGCTRLRQQRLLFRPGDYVVTEGKGFWCRPWCREVLFGHAQSYWSWLHRLLFPGTMHLSTIEALPKLT